jgi:predicted nucleotidyltransferase
VTENLHFVLRGIGGSTAHGLATPESDIDSHGVFAVPSGDLFGLQEPKQSYVGTDPDYSYHELKKFLSLALKANPTMLEVLWLDKYEEIESGWGESLVAIRSAFLSESYVRNAYMGYAFSQFRKLEDRGGTFSANTGKRTAKHAKHLFRLLEAGYDLLTTGDMSVRVKDRQKYEDIIHMDIDEWKKLFAQESERFHSAESVLPEHPDTESVERYLVSYRVSHLMGMRK